MNEIIDPPLSLILPEGLRLPIGYSVIPYKILIDAGMRTRKGNVVYTCLWGYNLCNPSPMKVVPRSLWAAAQPVHSGFQNNVFSAEPEAPTRAAIVNITAENLAKLSDLNFPDPYIRGWLLEGPINPISISQWLTARLRSQPLEKMLEIGRWFVVNDDRIPSDYYSCQPLNLVSYPKSIEDSLKMLVKDAFGGIKPAVTKPVSENPLRKALKRLGDVCSFHL